MSSIHALPLLRYALIGDAVASGATGLLAFAGADLLTDLLGLPVWLLRYAGLALLPYAAFVAWLGTRPHIAPGAVWLVIAINALWALDSVVLAVSGWLAPTALGLAFIAFQAVVVASFAAAQAYALRTEVSSKAIHA